MNLNNIESSTNTVLEKMIFVHLFEFTLSLQFQLRTCLYRNNLIPDDKLAFSMLFMKLILSLRNRCDLVFETIMCVV
jgi:hypothetical protein